MKVLRVLRLALLVAVVVGVVGFPDEFTVFREMQPPPIFVWLVPITEKEAEIARRLGADAFEERLEDWQQKENLLDLSRVGMVDV